MSESTDSIVYSLVACAGTLVLALLIVTFVVSATARRITLHRARVVQAWKRQGMRFVLGPAQANFLNRAPSIGTGGNGTLALTSDALRFAQVTPDREIVIPLRDIRRAALARAFNGRHGGPFLVIERVIGDLTGFQTEQPERWAEAINAALAGAASGASDSSSAARAPAPAAVS